MTLFSLDTSTRAGSMAIWQNGRAVGRPGADSRSHAERLPTEAVDFLAAERLTLADVDAFVVVAGPGSFTGLRVGVSAVQGWAFALGKPVAAVPTLEALVASLAEAATPDVVVVPCMDGLRGEVFYGAWRAGAAVIDASVGSPEDVVAAVSVAAAGAPVVVAGDGAVKYAAVWAAAGWRQVEPRMTIAEAAARLVGDERIAAGPPHAARPLYVRRTDAEIVRERKASASD